MYNKVEKNSARKLRKKKPTLIFTYSSTIKQKKNIYIYQNTINFFT